MRRDANAATVSSASPKGSWSLLAQAAAAVAAVGGLGLHLIGATADDMFFRRWGLDAALFPRSTDQTIILGYRALFEGLTEAVISLLRSWPILLAYGVLLAVGLAVALGWDRFPRLMKVKAVLERRVTVLRLGAAILVSIAVPTVLFPMLLMTAVIALVLPLSAGEQYAQRSVRAMLEDFKGGCERPDSLAKCAVVSIEGKVAARGFLIAAGATYMALYDPEANRVMLVPREKASLVGAPHFLSYPPGWGMAK